MPSRRRAKPKVVVTKKPKGKQPSRKSHLYQILTGEILGKNRRKRLNYPPAVAAKIENAIRKGTVNRSGKNGPKKVKAAPKRDLNKGGVAAFRGHHPAFG